MEKMSVNGKDYEILKLLGHGKGGYSYLATDGSRNYVLKQIHHEPCSYYTFGNKIEAEKNDYGRLAVTGIAIPKMIEIDEKYFSQIKEMCGKLYPLNLNIDYFPTNFVVQNGKIYYIDYECNNYMEEWNFENWGIKYWSKTPEFLKYIEDHK